MQNLIVRGNDDVLVAINMDDTFLDVLSYAHIFDGPTSTVGINNPDVWDIDLKDYAHIMVEVPDSLHHLNDYSRLLIEAKYCNCTVSLLPELTTAYWMNGSIEDTYRLINHFRGIHPRMIIINPCLAPHINNWIEETYRIPVAGIMQPFETSHILGEVARSENITTLPEHNLSDTWYVGTMSDQGEYCRQYSLAICNELGLDTSATVLEWSKKRCRFLERTFDPVRMIPNMGGAEWLSAVSTCEGMIHFVKNPTVVRMSVWAAAVGKICIGSFGGFVDLLFPNAVCHLGDLEKIKDIINNKEEHIEQAQGILYGLDLDFFKEPFEEALRKL